jgi:hypothetical protein
MIAIDQKVTVHCTDTDKNVKGTIVRIRPDGFDVGLDEFIIKLKKHRPGIYVGQQSGMEFVVRTDV